MNRLSRVAVFGALAFGIAASPLVAQTAGAIVNVTLPNTLDANDDSSTDVVPLNIGGASGLNFFGNNYTQVYVNNNGNLTFTGPLSQFTPNGLALGVQCDNAVTDANGNTPNCPIIAPFFAD